MLRQYEVLFNKVNKDTKPDRVFPGISQLISDYEEIGNANEADVFFEKYGVGNANVGIHNPFERQLAYELLLQILHSLNAKKYHQIHKGTPYYFISWTAFQNYDIAKAIFYMDAAVSEDLKIPEVQNKISSRPSLSFFLLNTEAGPSGLSIHLEVKSVFNKILKEYTTHGGGIITIDSFRNKFIEDMLYSGSDGRSLLTALFTFVLEYKEKSKQIYLRSDTGGSIQPFLDHLFDGARILESILEKKGGKGSTLEHKIKSISAIEITGSVLKGGKTLKGAERYYLSLSQSGSNFQDCNFACSYIIRNTTGHSLLWPDQFLSGESYSLLFNCLINAIFWAIEKLWIDD